MKQVSILVSLVSLLAFATLFPLTTSAATNQELIDTALKRLESDGSIMHMNARVRVAELDLMGNTDSTGDVEFQIKTKTQPTNDPEISNSDGRFTLSKFNLATSDDALLSTFELDAPFVIEWVNLHPMKYIRLQQIPSSVGDFFSILGVNILGIQKTWLGFEWTEDTFGSALSIDESFSGIDSALDVTGAESVNVSPLIVTGVERTYRNAAGETILRTRANLNPEYVNALYQNRIVSGAMNTEVAETERAEQLRLAESLDFAINYNQTKARIERIEMGGKVTEPRKGGNCELIGNEFICETIGTTVTTYSVGMTYFPDNGRPIEDPHGWRWFDEISDRLEVKEEEGGEMLLELLSKG